MKYQLAATFIYMRKTDIPMSQVSRSQVSKEFSYCLKNCQGLWNLTSDMFKGIFPPGLKLVCVSISVHMRMSTFYLIDRLH